MGGAGRRSDPFRSQNPRHPLRLLNLLKLRFRKCHGKAGMKGNSGIGGPACSATTSRNKRVMG